MKRNSPLKRLVLPASQLNQFSSNKIEMATASQNRKSNTLCADQDPPVTFQSPGLKPDIRLKVFNKEFHAHSMILKLYSAYFRKFLDSPEKKNYGSQTGLFRYDYISVVDYDGGWGMEPVALVPGLSTDHLKELCSK